MKNRKLFMSFTTLLHAIMRNTVTAEDLDNGLYMFGCTRGHALNPGANGEYDERAGYGEPAIAAHKVLVAALLKAEQENRAAWIRLTPQAVRDSYEVINELLTAHQMPTVTRTLDDGWYHSYPAMARHLQSKMIPVEPVY